MKKFLLSLALFATAATASFAQSNVITKWNWETGLAAFTNGLGATTVTGPTISGISADIGTGTASGVHATAATVWSVPAGNGSVRSLSANNWLVGDYFQFASSTTGFTNIGVSWSQTGSGTGPRDFSLSYSLDGTSYTPIVSNALISVSFNAAIFTTTNNFNVDFSSIPALNNASTVFFRLTDLSATSINNAAVGTAGTGRVDDFTIYEFAAIPEPATITLAVLGAVGLAANQLRRQRRR